MTKQVAMTFTSIQIRINDLAAHAKQMNKNEVKHCLKQIVLEHNEAIGYFILFSCLVIISILIFSFSYIKGSLMILRPPSTKSIS